MYLKSLIEYIFKKISEINELFLELRGILLQVFDRYIQIKRKKHIEINMRMAGNPKYHSFVNSLFKKKACLSLVQLHEKSEEISFLCPQFFIIWFVIYICICHIN